ncbi:AraC family transcriptional regulator (plasmid) [Pseudoalteromonas espejiana]
MPLTDIAFAAGFNSVRRFNDAFLQQLNIAPSQLRKSKKEPTSMITLTLPFEPPYHGRRYIAFYQSD